MQRKWGKIVVGGVFLVVGALLIWFAFMCSAAIGMGGGIPIGAQKVVQIIAILYDLVMTPVGWPLRNKKLGLKLVYCLLTGLVPGYVVLKAWDAIDEGLSGK